MMNLSLVFGSLHWVLNLPLTLSELFFIGFSKKLVLLRDTRGGSLSDIRHFGNVLFNNECECVAEGKYRFKQPDRYTH